MYLQSVKTVYYLNACLFHLLAPADVVFLVKSGTKLNKRHYLFAVFCGSYESAYDFAVSCNTVKRYLYGRNVRIVSRLIKQTQEVLELVVGVRQKYIVL